MRFIQVTIYGQAFAGKGDLFDWEPLTTKRLIRPLKQDPNGTRTSGVRVFGDSMIGDGIFDGDYLIYLHSTIASPNSIVVLQSPYGILVKRFSPQSDGTIRLMSSNPDHKDQVWPATEIKLIGIVKRLERDY